MPSILRIAISLALLAVTTNAASLGKECDSNRDCSDGATCVAGDSETSVQRCVAGAPCGGSNLGACPGDETSGQLACIWRPDKACSANPSGCTSVGNQFGIYKCISLDRCDSYFSGQCSGSCKINGKQCNGRGTCLLSGNSTSSKPAFECECESGWNGKLCDNVKDDTCVVDAGHCGDHGTCVKNACVCSGGYTGEQCQIPPKSMSSSGSMGDTPTPSNTTKSPVPSPSASNSSASRANSNNIVVTDKSKSSGPSALVIILGVLAALILVVAVMFMFVARKRRREQEAANAGEFNRTDSAIVPEAGRPPTPKTKIVIM